MILFDDLTLFDSFLILLSDCGHTINLKHMTSNQEEFHLKRSCMKEKKNKTNLMLYIHAFKMHENKQSP